MKIVSYIESHPNKNTTNIELSLVKDCDSDSEFSLNQIGDLDFQLKKHIYYKAPNGLTYNVNNIKQVKVGTAPSGNIYALLDYGLYSVHRIDFYNDQDELDNFLLKCKLATIESNIHD